MTKLTNLMGALFLCPLAVRATLVSVELPPEVIAEVAHVRLGQVVRLSGAEPNLMRRLADLPLGKVPLGPEGTLLERTMLARWIRRQTGLREEQIDWRGESVTRVTLASVQISEEALQQAAEGALRQWLSERVEWFSIRLANRISGIALPGRNLRLEVQPIRQEQPLPRMHVQVDILGEHGRLRSVLMSFDVTAYAKGIVVTHGIEAGRDPVEVFEERSVEVTARNRSGKLLETGDVRGDRPSRLRRNLRAGEPVFSSDIEPAPAVQRGAWVTLRMKNGDIAIESRVQALQDGVLGQGIRVKRVGAERSIFARVSGNDIVEVSQ